MLLSQLISYVPRSDVDAKPLPLHPSLLTADDLPVLRHKLPLGPDLHAAYSCLCTADDQIFLMLPDMPHA
jgi:hypothetical protein